MKTKFMLIIAGLLICLLSANAQNNKKIADTIYTVDKVIPSYLIPTSADAINNRLKVLEHRKNRNNLECLLSLNENTTAVLVDTLTDFAGGYHESYKEYYNGIEVEGTRCTIHYDLSGNITSINGNFRTISQLNTVPSINESSALHYALNDVAAEKYAWEDPAREQMLKIIKNNSNATSYPKGKIVIFASSDVISLAYKFNIQSSTPRLSLNVFVNAEDGRILGKYDINHKSNATTSVATRYSGQRTITTDSYAGSYRLRDYTRANIIKTIDNSSFYDYYSLDNTWTQLSNYDRIALDAHWGLETTYDYYLDKFGRNSYDNNGAALVSHVNEVDEANAYWSSQWSWFVFGVDSHNQPYVDLDVVAHEYTHAVTDNTSNLIYEGESGAINEGLSDVMAVCVENEAKPNNGQMIWVIGENIKNGGIRDMRYPNCKFYYGTAWKDVTNNYNDNGGVHTNSGVFNYWFYLLANGGSGTNEIGIDYDIDGIGLDQAIRICYLMNTAYMTSNCDFTDACRCSYLAATQLGYTDMMDQIKEAWIAVGVELPSNVTITGQDMLCSQGTFQVSNLPSFYSVVWNLSGTNASDFSISTPNEYCILNTANYNMERSVTLNAIIMHYGKIIKTLSKDIHTHSDYLSVSGTQYEYRNNSNNYYPEQAISYTAPYAANGYSSSQIAINMDCDICLVSPRFKGMQISFKGEFLPLHVWCREDTISFHTSPYTLPPLYRDGRPIPGISTPLTYSLSMDVSSDNDCKDFTLNFIASRIPYLNNPELTISIIGNMLEIYFSEYVSDPIGSGMVEDWQLMIVNSQTGQMVLSESVTGNSTSVNIGSLPSGLYIIRAIYCGNTYTAKFSK